MSLREHCFSAAAGAAVGIGATMGAGATVGAIAAVGAGAIAVGAGPAVATVGAATVGFVGVGALAAVGAVSIDAVAEVGSGRDFKPSSFLAGVFAGVASVIAVATSLLVNDPAPAAEGPAHGGTALEEAPRPPRADILVRGRTITSGGLLAQVKHAQNGTLLRGLSTPS